MLANIFNSAVLLYMLHLSLSHKVLLKKKHNSSNLHASSTSTFKIAKPSKTQARWLDFEVGASIHFNMQTFNKYMKRGDVVPPNTFNPRNLSTDQWVKAASSFGAKYIVLTLDHFSGFLLWSSETYNYSVKSTKWREGRGDIASDFIKSCQKMNVEYGFFYSVKKNWFMNVEDFKTKSPKKQKTYNRIVLQQLKELFQNSSKYSDPFYIWFDAGTEPKVNPSIGPLIRSLAKDSICDECKSFAGNQGVRWVGNENALAPLPNWYAVQTGKCDVTPGDPLGEVFCPASCDTVIREHYWFWHKDTEYKVKTPQRLIQEYLTSVGRGCNLILNLNPDTRGLVPDIDLKVYRIFGQGIQLLYKSPVVKITAPLLKIGNNYTVNSDPLEVINGSLVMMENVIDYGQLVEEYLVYYSTVENKTVKEKGSSIGHKRIHPFPKELYGLTLKEVKINIKKLVSGGAMVELRRIRIYDWSEAKKEGYLDDEKEFLTN
ncbi:alpha-L-fucosidase 1-like [Actinia tenebrosa]|uniref:alpha-L-fucosidase n=1 Tax=Actinia tenebrosa TaxID=6105 RepID=A0A6P8IS72_ACTTE|nr:alpha-L-fucosidase 1-like [Actinia tenebrosa]